MTRFENLSANGDSDEAGIVPLKPDESHLMQQIRLKNGAAAMPQDSKPLKQAEIDLIEKWISEGASNDSPIQTKAHYDSEHPPVYHTAPVITSVDYSPDGKLVAISGFHEVLIRTTDGTKTVARLIGRSERIESICFSPDGKLLAVAAGSPGVSGEIQIWNVAKKKLELSKSVGYDTLYGVSWSDDGKLIAFGCPDNSLRVLELKTGKQVFYNRTHSDWVLDTAFSRSSTHLVSVSRDRSMKLFDFKTERFIDNITSIAPGATKGRINAVDRHPAKDQLFMGGSDGVGKLYKMHRDKDREIGDDFNLIHAFPKTDGQIYDVKFSSPGKLLATCSSNKGAGILRVYNVNNATEVFRKDVANSSLFALDFSPNEENVVTGGFDGKVRIFQVSTGKLITEFVPVEISKKE